MFTETCCYALVVAVVDAAVVSGSGNDGVMSGRVGGGDCGDGCSIDVVKSDGSNTISYLSATLCHLIQPIRSMRTYQSTFHCQSRS